MYCVSVCVCMCIDDLDIVCGMDMGYVSESVRVCVCEVILTDLPASIPNTD